MHLRTPCSTIAAILLAAIPFAHSLRADEPEPAPEKPFGLNHRVPWSTSRLVGSPEPPPAYTVERTFANLEWKAPIYVAVEPGSDHLLVVQAGGGQDNPSRILRTKNESQTKTAEPFFELPNRLLYAVCFDPNYSTNGWIYLFSNGPTPASERFNRISRYRVVRDPRPHIEPSSEFPVMEWRSAGHDGGDLLFGKDGMLYISTGDGTSDSDTANSGQTLDDLLGAVLRIDVRNGDDKNPYSSPPDNPFLHTPGARPEIWAYGLRNPWRMCIDSKSGDIWVGSNGQDLWEYVHRLGRGENYGWSVYEGSHPFYLGRKLGPTPLVPPTIEHPHSEFRSLTGGDVYYGSVLTELNGTYIYGDFSSGRIWGMKHDGKKAIWHKELADTTLQIAAFRTTPDGQLLVVDHAGGIYRLIPAPTAAPHPPFPIRLSDTGLFASVKDHKLAPGPIPYSVNAPAWTDGAVAERFVAVPGNARIDYDSGRSWNFPDGSALVQTLSIQCVEGSTETPFRIETRVLLRQQGEWAGYSYRWNADQTDADLVPKQGADAELILPISSNEPSRKHPWRFPSRTECMECHSRAANFILGLTEAQLNRDHDYAAVTDNQLRVWDHVGLFSKPLPNPPDKLSKITDPRDASRDLESRARAYLHVNCSVCHVAAGGGNAKMELGLDTPRENTNLIGARPQHDTFGIANAMLVASRDPSRSVLLHRLSTRGRGQMPPIVSRQVDAAAVQLFRDWIAQLPPDRPVVQDWKPDDFPDFPESISAKRSFESGQNAFRDTGCIQCHRFGTDGGAIGPDLTNVAKRLQPKDLLDSILLPSKVIAEGYAGVVIETADGKALTGRIEREDERSVTLRLASSTDPPLEILRADIIERRPSTISNMPTGTVNILRREEVLDLLAYLLTGP